MAIATLTLHAIATIIPCPRSKEGYTQQHFTKNRLHKFNRQHKPKARAVFHNTARAIFRFRDTYFFSCWGVKVLRCQAVGVSGCRGVKMSAPKRVTIHPHNLTTSHPHNLLTALALPPASSLSSLSFQQHRANHPCSRPPTSSWACHPVRSAP